MADINEQDSFKAFPLQGAHAVITGGARGIGAAICKALASRGADLTVLDLDENALKTFCKQLSDQSGRRVEYAIADVSDAGSVESAMAKARQGLGDPSILINNAGIAPSAPFQKTDLAMWQKVLDIDLTGAYLCTRQVLPAMIEAGKGRIVNVVSTAGLTGYPYVSAYCAAKHGLTGLTRALALEVARTGVTINAVCPGFTDTSIISEAAKNISNKTGRTTEEARSALAASNPQGRLIQPDEVAETVGWLCLPTSASITGQSIIVAGGELM
jgi:NAD(P)-dependent dehydrogenase (short-subunit alcohol dehydrogenase family)